MLQTKKHIGNREMLLLCVSGAPMRPARPRRWLRARPSDGRGVTLEAYCLGLPASVVLLAHPIVVPVMQLLQLQLLLLQL